MTALTAESVNVKPGVKGFVSLPLEERFWSKVDRRGPDECWPWNGSRTPKGYGQIWSGGRSVPAAQVAWALGNAQPFPEGMEGCHTCDNPPCVNPTHIFPGTRIDNMQDAAKKGRVYHTQPRSMCLRGLHPMEGGNLTAGKRQCRTCKNAGDRERRSAR